MREKTVFADALGGCLQREILRPSASFDQVWHPRRETLYLYVVGFSSHQGRSRCIPERLRHRDNNIPACCAREIAGNRGWRPAQARRTTDTDTRTALLLSETIGTLFHDTSKGCDAAWRPVTKQPAHRVRPCWFCALDMLKQRHRRTDGAERRPVTRCADLKCPDRRMRRRCSAIPRSSWESCIGNLIRTAVLDHIGVGFCWQLVRERRVRRQDVHRRDKG